jgi:DNA-binding NtrC family response regulator
MSERAEIGVVEDEANLRELIADVLGAEGHRVTLWPTISAAEAGLAVWAPDLLILDVKLPDGDGLGLLDRQRRQGLRIPAIVMTAFGTLERAVQALRAGASDFLVKPFDNGRLKSAVAAALAAGENLNELALAAGRAVGAGDLGRQIVGSAGGLEEVIALIPRIAATDATVLIRGESGTGKELVARAIHQHSERRDGPFVSINCAALPPSLLEAELFGFERGAFTGAFAQKKGLFEAAAGGSLFLDEIGDMALEAQSRLLRVLQEREIVRVGGRAAVAVDVRVIAATHRDLAAGVEAGSFRQDLRYRLDVVGLELPPLRERRADLPGLIDHFLDKHCRRHRAPRPRLSAEIEAWIGGHPWPGNVRELENFVERAVVLGRFELPRPSASAASAPAAPLPAPAVPVRPLREVVAQAERDAVVAALRAAAGNKAQAARLLGVSYKTLFNKMHEHGIKEERLIE